MPWASKMEPQLYTHAAVMLWSPCLPSVSGPLGNRGQTNMTDTTLPQTPVISAQDWGDGEGNDFLPGQEFFLNKIVFRADRLVMDASQTPRTLIIVAHPVKDEPVTTE